MVTKLEKFTNGTKDFDLFGSYRNEKVDNINYAVYVEGKGYSSQGNLNTLYNVDVSQYCPLDCGDVNEDGIINALDALIIISYSVNISVPYPVGQFGCPLDVSPCNGCNP